MGSETPEDKASRKKGPVNFSGNFLKGEINISDQATEAPALEKKP